MTDTPYYYVEIEFDNEDVFRDLYTNEDDARKGFEKRKEQYKDYKDDKCKILKISLKYSLFTDARLEKTKENLFEYARQNNNEDITFMLNSERNMLEYTLINNVDEIIEEVDY